MCCKEKEEEYTLNQVSLATLMQSEKPVKMKAMRVNEVLSYTKTQAKGKNFKAFHICDFVGGKKDTSKFTAIFQHEDVLLDQKFETFDSIQGDIACVNANTLMYMDANYNIKSAKLYNKHAENTIVFTNSEPV